MIAVPRRGLIIVITVIIVIIVILIVILIIVVIVIIVIIVKGARRGAYTGVQYLIPKSLKAQPRLDPPR